MENNGRRTFLKDTCKICVLGAVSFSVADFLASCGTAQKGFKTTVDNHKVTVPLTLFDANNAQIITMGARVIGPELAKAIVDSWLASDFDPDGPSASNVEAINKLDR